MKRPRGISVLSFFHATLAALILGLLLVTWLQESRARDRDGLFVAYLLRVMPFACLGLLLGLSGVWMWRARTIGWWLGGLYYIFRILSDIGLPDEFQRIFMLEPVNSSMMGKLGDWGYFDFGRMGIQLLLLGYLLTPGVRAFFGVGRDKLVAFIVAQIGVSIVLHAVLRYP